MPQQINHPEPAPEATRRIDRSQPFSDVEQDDQGERVEQDGAGTPVDRERPMRSREKQIGLDEIFDMIKNERRRRVLRFLSEQDSPVTMGALADHVAALENDKAPKLLTAQERKRVYVGLYQCHLPKMDELDVIEFNKDRGLIELGPQAPHLDRYLEGPYEPSLQWPLCYLGCSTAGVAAVGALFLFDLATTASLLIVTGLFLVSLCVLAAIHTYIRLGEVRQLLPRSLSVDQSTQ